MRRRYGKFHNVIVIFTIIKLSPVICAAGDYAADFLRIGVGARPLAMGGAFTAMTNDPSMFFWNPAGITQLNRMSIQVDHVPVFGGLAQYNAANVTLSFDERMGVGLSWIRLGVEDIPRYSELQGTRFDRLTNTQFRSTGQAEGYFADKEDAIMVSICRKDYFDINFGSGISEYVIPIELSFGLTGKYIHHKLDDKTGTGQGLDAGAALRIVDLTETHGEPDAWFSLGLSVRDLSRTSIVWNTRSKHKDEVDLGWQAGVACSKLFKGLQTRITLSADREFGFYTDYHVGGELLFFHVLAIRGGYYLNKFSAGAGITLLGFRVDYAFINHDLGNTHRISGSFRF